MDQKTDKEMMQECMAEVILMFENNKVYPSPDNITELTNTLFKAKKWGGSFK